MPQHLHMTQNARLQLHSSSSCCTKLWPSQQCHTRAQRHHYTLHSVWPGCADTHQHAVTPTSSTRTTTTTTNSHSRKRPSVVPAATARPPTPTDDRDDEDEQQQATTSTQHQERVDAGSSSNSNRSPPNPTPARPGSPFSIDDPQLLVGDCVALVSAALYRQIAAIVLSPTFPGWLAPLSFNPLRFVEFANFAGMLVASWVVAATLTGGYSGAAVGAGVPGALRAVCRAWLVAMPICAAHLVLVTASESQALVGDEGFAGVLPLAAAGPGEPLGTAAALLGLMAMWRAFYAAYLDTWAWASPRDVAEDAAGFREALASVALVAAGCSLLLQVLQLSATLNEASMGAGGGGADGSSLAAQMLLLGHLGAA